ncbi:hypothetical protein JHN52_26985, partial [Streptomyces sp. MBT97]
GAVRRTGAFRSVGAADGAHGTAHSGPTHPAGDSGRADRAGNTDHTGHRNDTDDEGGAAR